MKVKDLIKYKLYVAKFNNVKYVSYKTECPICALVGRHSRLTVKSKTTIGSVVVRYMKCKHPHCLGSLFSFKVVSEGKYRAIDK